MTDTITYKMIRERIKTEAKEIIDDYAQFPTENTHDSCKTHGFDKACGVFWKLGVEQQ